MSRKVKPDRKQQILETLARELEANPGTRITTACLAEAVGVSEAALYRHFSSKAKMFEALIDFTEDSIFGLINKILDREKNVIKRCENIMHIILTFSEKNPGITRIMAGDALVGENDRLRLRIVNFFERIETQFRQVLREANLSNEVRIEGAINASANHLTTIIEGKLSQYVRSVFEKKPTDHWQEQWALIVKSLFR